ncbi:MAG: hypothetical protein QM635_02765 [Microbacteriaceae bacterium]
MTVLGLSGCAGVAHAAGSSDADDACTTSGAAYAQAYGDSAELVSYGSATGSQFAEWEADRTDGVADETEISNEATATFTLCYFDDVKVAVPVAPTPEATGGTEPYTVVAIIVDSSGAADFYSAAPASSADVTDFPSDDFTVLNG